MTAKEQQKQDYETFIKPYLETKDPSQRKKALEVTCNLLTPFIRNYSRQRHFKLCKFKTKIPKEDIESTAYYAVAAHLDQAKPVDYPMFYKYLTLWVRKEVSTLCHFKDDFISTFSEVADSQNVFEVTDPGFSTEKSALFKEIFDMMKDVVEDLPPVVRDSLKASYVREDTTYDMIDKLPYFTNAMSYWNALKRSVPLLKAMIIEKFGERGYEEIEEFFIQEDFS